jgi:hypothetical protein
VAAVEVAVAGVHVFVNTARYWLPLIATVGLLITNVPVVAPEMLPPLLRFEKEPPPLVLTCHCTVGAGVPLVAAVNVALASP